VSEGDTLISVDGISVFGNALDSLRNVIPGPAMTTVTLGFQTADGQRREVELIRSTARQGRKSNPALAQSKEQQQQQVQQQVQQQQQQQQADEMLQQQMEQIALQPASGGGESSAVSCISETSSIVLGVRNAPFWPML
jgi:hypothetical protein